MPQQDLAVNHWKRIRPRTRYALIAVAVCALVVAVLVNRAYRGLVTQAWYVAQQAEMTTPGQFNQLATGMTIDEVEARLASFGRHQFTVIRDGKTFVCRAFFVERMWDRFYLLFLEGELVKILKPPEFQYENTQLSQYPGTSLSTQLPVDPMARIQEVLDAPALARTEIRRIITTWQQDRPDEGWSALPVAVVFALPLMVRMMKDNEQNQELCVHFNPSRLKLGMSIDEVDVVFGIPQAVGAGETGETVRVYGKPGPQPVAGGYEFSWVSVGFSDGRAVWILSGEFFEESLYRSFESAATTPPEEAAD